jgi:hypothetical protein
MHQNGSGPGERGAPGRLFLPSTAASGARRDRVMQRASDRVVAAVFCQTVGHRPENPTVMYRHSKDNWVPDFLKRRADVSADRIEK